MPGKLTIVPTPIGNLGDMTPRAARALQEADTVCAEDTRVTGKLLAALGIEGKRLERLDENMMGWAANAAHAATPEETGDVTTVADSVVLRVLEGENIAYCSDAVMPGVSDPGARLVQAARAAGVAVEVLPGPTAAAVAYVASGFTCPRYYFGGFFPRKAGEQRRVLQGLAQLDAVLVFYESPHRVAAALAAVAQELPCRHVAVCRELTKLHEEVHVALSGDAAKEFARREREEGIRGEIVLVVDAPDREERELVAADAADAARARAAELLAAGSGSKKDIARTLCAEFGVKRNEAYGLVQELAAAGAGQR